MTVKAKNQHFVPQFSLRHFCGPNGKLFVFDKPQEKVFQSPTDEVAASNYFYDLDPSMLKPGVNPQLVENSLAKAETLYAEALDTTITSLHMQNVLCPDALPVVAEFMAVQAMRTREVRTHMQQMNKLCNRSQSELALAANWASRVGENRRHQGDVATDHRRAVGCVAA